MNDSLFGIEKKISHKIKEIKDKTEKTYLITGTNLLWIIMKHSNGLWHNYLH